MKRLIEYLLSQIWYYTMYTSSDDAHLNPSSFNNIPFILSMV